MLTVAVVLFGTPITILLFLIHKELVALRDILSKDEISSPHTPKPHKKDYTFFKTRI